MGGGSRLAVPGLVLACPGVVGGWGDAVIACPLSSYGCGVCAPCGVLYCVRRLLLVSGAVALASCRLSDLRRRDGRRGGGLLGYRGVVHHVSSMDVYNKYDV